MLLEEIKKYKIYLASQSPRRRELLAGMGFDFEVMPTHVKEVHPEGCTPAQLVEHLSRLKLSAVKLEDFPENALFIACDTVVVLEGKALGKPVDRTEALAMLHALAGRCHTVYTGVCLRTAKCTLSFTEHTNVHFRPLNDAELAYYVDTFHPYDKAGAYGIQEWIGMVGISHIEGCYYNVMGLPVASVYEHLQKLFPCLPEAR